MATVSKVIQSKVVIVGSYTGPSYGYTSGLYGDIKDVEYGATSKSASLYGFGDDEITILTYYNSLDAVRFSIGGANTATNTAANWTSITIGSTTYTRASATYNSSGTPYWQWAASGTNPFGTTSGVAIDVDINLDVDDAAGSSAISVSNPYLTNGSASTVTVSFVSGLATNQSYRIYLLSGGEVAGPTPYLEPVGYTSDGTTSQTITLSSQYLPIDNSLVSYRVQTSGRYVPEDAPFASWTNVVGDEVNTTFQVQRGEVATKSSTAIPPVADIRFGQNASYSTRTVDLSRFAGMDVHIIFHHDLPNPDNGSVFTGDLQIDNVQFDGNTYSFENSGQSWQTTTIGRGPYAMPLGSSWASLAVGSTAERWNVATGNTGSGNTGNLGATAGSYYVYTETSSPVVTGDGFWLRSPLVTLSGSPGNLTFSEGRQGANIGTLRTYIHVVDTNNPDISIYNPQERVLPNDATSFSAEILGNSAGSGTSSDTTYQIRETSFSGPVLGSAVGQGTGLTKIAVSDAPSSRTTKTYYVTAFLTSSGSSTVTSINSFDVRRGGVAPTSAVNTVSLATKYISQGSTGGSTGASFGYRRGDGTSLGDIGNTSSFATSDGSLSSVWASTSFSARQIVFVQSNPAYHDELRFKVQGNPGNGLDWTRLRIADSSTTSTTTGREFKRTDAIYTYDPSFDETTWVWTNDRNENPLPTGEHTAEIVKELNTGYQLSISNTSLTGTQTDSSSAVFSSAETFAQYKIIKTSGTTPGGTADGATVASFAGGSSGFTISIGTNDQPSAGQTCNYKVQLKSRYGDDSFVDTTGQNNTFSITRASTDSAPVISDVTNDNAAAPSVTVTVSLSDNGSGGTGLYYGRASTNNSDNVTTWQTSSTFSQNRGDDFYYFASRQNTVGSGNTLASTGVLEEVDFLLPDRDINFTLTPGSSISAAYAGNVTVNVTDGSPNNRYRALRTTGGNLGCGNTGLIAGTTGTITIGDAANELPVSGSSFSYTLQARRGTSIGGDDVTWYTVTSSPSTFTISRGASAAPVISDVTNDNDASASVQVTVTLSNIGTGGTGLFYGRASTNNSDNVTSWQTGNTFQQNRGTDFYYFASRSSDTGANNGLASTGVLESVGYIAPDSSISAQNVTFSGSTNETTSVTVLGTTAGDTIEVRVNSAPYTISYGSAVATGASTVVPVTSGLPTQGNTTTYRLSATRPTSTGGDGFFDISSDTFTITREADSAPTFTVTYSDTETQSVSLTFNFSDVGSGGDGNLYYAIDDTLGFTPPPFGWSQTAPSSQVRNTTRKYWVSRVSNGQSLVSAFQLNVPYRTPDSNISLSPSTQTVSSGVASVSFTITGASTNHFYELFDGSEDPSKLFNPSGSATSSTFVISDDPNYNFTDGTVLNLDCYVTLPQNRGGDGLPVATDDVAEVVFQDQQLFPNPFSFTDVESASVGQIYDTFVQIIGTGGTSQTASSVSGTATFAVSSTTTTPGSGFNQTAKQVSEGQYLHVRMQADSQPNTLETSTIAVGDRSDDWRITTGSLPATTFNIVLYGDASASSIPTSVSSDVVVGRANGDTPTFMIPGDVVKIRNENGPSSESSNLVIEFSRIGGRFEGEYADQVIAVGQSYSATIASASSGLAGPMYLRITQENESSFDGARRPYPIFVRQPVLTRNEYGVELRGPNGTTALLNNINFVINRQKDTASSITLAAGASTTISSTNLGDIERILIESFDGGDDLELVTVDNNTVEITNTGSTSNNFELVTFKLF